MEEWIERLGYFAGFCTTVAFLPQAVRVWRRKRAEDLSLPAFSLLNLGIVCWLIFGITTAQGPIILTNGVTLVLTLSVLYLAIRYRQKS